MATEEAIGEFLSSFQLGEDAYDPPDTPRIWFTYLDGPQVVFAVADGENIDGADLAAIAGRAMDALRTQFAECADYTFRLEEE
jgi:hypothetical protein